MNKSQIQEVLDNLFDCQKHVNFYVSDVIDIARAMIMQLGAQVDALEIDNATLSHGNAHLMHECIKLKRQNDKYRSVLTSELHAVYEVRQSKWRKRRDLDPVMAIHCTKHEAMTLCQYWNQANNKDGIFFYIAKEGDI